MFTLSHNAREARAAGWSSAQAGKDIPCPNCRKPFNGPVADLPDIHYTPLNCHFCEASKPAHLLHLCLECSEVFCGDCAHSPLHHDPSHSLRPLQGGQPLATALKALKTKAKLDVGFGSPACRKAADVADSVRQLLLRRVGEASGATRLASRLDAASGSAQGPGQILYLPVIITGRGAEPTDALKSTKNAESLGKRFLKVVSGKESEETFDNMVLDHLLQLGEEDIERAVKALFSPPPIAKTERIVKARADAKIVSVNLKRPLGEDESMSRASKAKFRATIRLQARSGLPLVKSRPASAAFGAHQGSPGPVTALQDIFGSRTKEEIFGSRTKKKIFGSNQEIFGSKRYWALQGKRAGREMRKPANDNPFEGLPPTMPLTNFLTATASAQATTPAPGKAAPKAPKAQSQAAGSSANGREEPRATDQPSSSNQAMDV